MYEHSQTGVVHEEQPGQVQNQVPVAVVEGPVQPFPEFRVVMAVDASSELEHENLALSVHTPLFDLQPRGACCVYVIPCGVFSSQPNVRLEPDGIGRNEREKKILSQRNLISGSEHRFLDGLFIDERSVSAAQVFKNPFAFRITAETGMKPRNRLYIESNPGGLGPVRPIW